MDTEPELVAVWRRIIARRDELVAEHERWIRPDHPIAEYVARVAAACGGQHGYTDRRLADLEQQARDNAERARDELRRFDMAIVRGTRENYEDRSHTLPQLRALADDEGQQLARRGRAAIAQWLRSGSWAAKAGAEHLLRRIVSVHGSTADSPRIDLHELREDDQRRARTGPRPSFAPERVAQRIVARFLHASPAPASSSGAPSHRYAAMLRRPGPPGSWPSAHR